MMCHMTDHLAPAAAGFFAALAADNTREHWVAHRAAYDHDLRPRFVALVEQVQGWGPWRVYRPHNDTRFRPDGPPLKDFLGAVAERPGGVGALVRLDRDGLLLATGIPMPAADQLARYRAAVAAAGPGEAFEAAVAAVEGAGDDVRVHGGRWAPLQRVPRGHPADHPRAGRLRWKGVEITARPGPVTWLDGSEAPAQVAALLERGAPLHDWLAEHVGPGALTPQERFAPRAAASRVAG